MNWALPELQVCMLLPASSTKTSGRSLEARKKTEQAVNLLAAACTNRRVVAAVADDGISKYPNGIGPSRQLCLGRGHKKIRIHVTCGGMKGTTSRSGKRGRRSGGTGGGVKETSVGNSDWAIDQGPILASRSVHIPKTPRGVWNRSTTRL